MRTLPPHLATVLAALNFREDGKEELREIDDGDWESLLSVCDRMRLTLVLGQTCGQHVPDWVRVRINRNVDDNLLRFSRIAAEYSELARFLKAASCDHLVLKGFTQWPDPFESARFRTQSDIDIFLPPEDMSRGRDALVSVGYEPIQGVEHMPTDHLPPMMRKVNWTWRDNHYDPEIPVGLELHFRFWNALTTRLRPRGLDEFWSRRIRRDVNGFEFPALHPVDNLGYGALHVLHHLLFGGLIPYHVYELAHLLHTHANDEEFWHEWRSAHDDSLRRMEAVSFRLASDWFACTLPDQVEEEIQSLSPTVQKWFEDYGNSHIHAMQRPNKDRLWLHLSLLESSKDKYAVFFGTLLPVRVPPLKEVGRWSLPVFPRFVQYAASRVAHHLGSVPKTLLEGVRWWGSTKQLDKRFWTFYGASFCFDLGMFVFFFLYNLYLLDCGMTEKFVGLVTSAMAIGSMLGTIPAGVMAQRVGLRKTLFLCFVLVSLTAALRVTFVSSVLQIVLAGLAGAATTAWAVCLPPALAQLTTEQSRPFGFSLVFSFGIGEGVLGGLIGGNLPGWLSHIRPSASNVELKQMSLLIACGIVALGLWPISRLRFSTNPVRETKVFPRNSFLFRFLPAIAVWSLVTGAFSPFFNVYAAQHLKLALKQIGMLYSASQLSQVAAIMIAPMVFKKYGLVTGIMYTQVATAIMLACLAGTSTASGAAVAYVSFMAFQWMSEPGMFSLLMTRVAPTERSGASALNFLVISSANAIAAAAAGLSFARFGYPVVLAAIAGLALIAAFLFRTLLGNEVSVSPQHSTTTLSLGR
jgi:predicted MFS family arabinose efflux permease